jgi:hypothetical protein
LSARYSSSRRISSTSLVPLVQPSAGRSTPTARPITSIST